MDLKSYCKNYFTDIVFKHFFDFNGRANRKLFWLFTLNLLIINLILNYLLNRFDYVGIIIGLVFSVIMFFPILGLDVRRLHDINLSGWWVLLCFIPVLGLVAIVVYGCIPGTEGENKYGPVPADTAAITE